MGSIIKIKEMKSSFTKSEKLLGDYILDNLKKVLNLNTYELAEKSGVSQATIVRFAKKLGYSGYPSFRVALSEDLGKRSGEGKDPMYIHSKILIDDSSKDILNKVAYENIGAIQNTLSIADERDIDMAVSALREASKILLLGMGHSGIVGQDFQYKLWEIGKHAIYIADTQVQMANLTTLSKGDVIFAISHNGNTLELINVLKAARDREITVITLTKLGINPISDLADISLKTVAEDIDVRSTALSSRIAQLVITDTLHLRLVQEDYSKVGKYIKETTEIVKINKV